MDVHVKQEPLELLKSKETTEQRNSDNVPRQVSYIDLSSTDSDDSDDSDNVDALIDSIIGRKGKESSVSDVFDGGVLKKRRTENPNVVVPAGFLDPLTPMDSTAVMLPNHVVNSVKPNPTVSGSVNKQFWKAGDYDGAPPGNWDTNSVGMDHVRVHPKFLHSNATSHKWALGAFAELLDNALDEIYSGATYASIDMLQNEKDGNRMLLIEDNGGGMDPDKMRQCMSLGYSAKSKLANTIGQYGNGFKTSTMRLGADVIVFSRCSGKDGKSPTQSIGLLSYTFLRSTGKEDIVVPMLDYERGGTAWNKMIRSTPGDWNMNVETIVHWSPFSDEADLLRQFNLMKDHGTRIIIYNLWEDDQGMLELDFDSDKHDILLRGANRDEKSIEMATQFPNSRHFLTYRHSLRSYASILYLRHAPGFRVILRGQDVEHHNIVNDMMLSQEITYRPQPGSEGVSKDMNMLAVVTIGFVKDAKFHIDVQGFNVYHKNRLIKPFWRIWNTAGSDGRGVIGVLEANFVEPAHDKQGFERTTVLSRLETKLIQMQKMYWRTNCHKIGYAPRLHKDDIQTLRETSPRFTKASFAKSGKSSNGKQRFSDASPASSEENSDNERHFSTSKTQTKTKGGNCKRNGHSASKFDSYEITQLREENRELKERLMAKGSENTKDLLLALQQEKEKCKSLETQLEEAERKIDDLNREQESLIDIFSEERDRRDIEEENLRKKLKDASNTIQQLLDKVRR